MIPGMGPMTGFSEWRDVMGWHGPVAAQLSVTGAGKFGVAFSIDSSKAYVSNATTTGTLRVINTATGTEGASITVGNTPRGVAASPNGSWLCVCNSGDATVSIVSTATSSVASTIAVGSAPFYAAFSPDGAWLYVTNSVSNTISKISTATWTVTATITGIGSNPRDIAITPDGAYALVACSSANTLNRVTLATSSVFAVAVGTLPRTVCLSPNGATAYVTNNSSASVSVVNVSTMAVERTINTATGPYGCAISKDGGIVLVTCFTAGRVARIDTRAGTATDYAVEGSIYSVAFAPNGAFAYVVSGATSGSVHRINRAP